MAKSVWLICGTSQTERLSKNSGRYPFNSEYNQIIAVCDSKNVAVKAAKEHITHSASQAEKFYEGEGVNQMVDASDITVQDLDNGVAYLAVREWENRELRTVYYIKIKEWTVLEE